MEKYLFVGRRDRYVNYVTNISREEIFRVTLCNYYRCVGNNCLSNLCKLFSFLNKEYSLHRDSRFEDFQVLILKVHELIILNHKVKL